VKKVMVAEALSDLVIYTQSVKFTSFSHARLHQTPHQNTSMGEKKAHKLARASGKSTEWYLGGPSVQSILNCAQEQK
jgi:hypothetical protein